MQVQVIAHPKSKNPRIESKAGILHVYVSALPMEGKANIAVGAALAKYFKVAKSRVVLLKGETAKQKLFEVNK